MNVALVLLDDRTAPMTRYSLLDLVPVVEGSSVAEALAYAADLARHAESLGFTRYWVAEHHGMKGIASAATSPPRQRRSASAQAASCCPTIHRW
jgi:alkanesulfonate monooxygenase SsuD/methylene tetrahydromethanopterin reductase-like flavin-dependent oxidoreductase (luciferase family)